MYNELQLREIFHLEFLRWLGRKIKGGHYLLKGGANLRFFFKSFRYSEDMDLDAYEIRKDILLDAVMGILESPSFQNTLRPFGIERIMPPDLTKAKQTETTQKFKTHLLTFAGEDLFTKIEFSKRGVRGDAAVEPVSDDITRPYKILPLIVPHYDLQSAIEQKICALGARAVTQARDIFDLYILSSQYVHKKPLRVAASRIKNAHERIFDIDFEVYRDTVVSYFSVEDQNVYNNPGIWDEIKLKTAHFLEELGAKNG